MGGQPVRVFACRFGCFALGLPGCRAQIFDFAGIRQQFPELRLFHSHTCGFDFHTIDRDAKGKCDVLTRHGLGLT